MGIRPLSKAERKRGAALLRSMCVGMFETLKTYTSVDEVAELRKKYKRLTVGGDDLPSDSDLRHVMHMAKRIAKEAVSNDDDLTDMFWEVYEETA